MAPEKLVMTEAAAHHGWDKHVPPDHRESAAVTAEAVLAICTSDIDRLTGRTFFSGALLDQLGIAMPATAEG